MSPEFADFQARNKDAKIASRLVEEFLYSCVKVVDVKNVEDDREYQVQDIDLLCILEIGNQTRTISIEIKGDTKAHLTGNFFFETISNEALNTQGCFLKSEADLLFYYLMGSDCLYVFPMKSIKSWFLEMYQKPDLKDAFQAKKTHTLSSTGSYQHTTVGRCVNIKYTLKSLKEQGLPFKEISEMCSCRCMIDDFCLDGFI